MSLNPRPGIMDVAPYVGGESKVAGVNRVIRLASNENPLGPSAQAVAAYTAEKDQLHRYPDGSASALRAAIAEAESLEAARIVCGAGSDELIALLVRAYAGQGDEETTDVDTAAMLRDLVFLLAPPKGIQKSRRIKR